PLSKAKSKAISSKTPAAPKPCPIRVVDSSPVYKKINRVISNSFGFGGHNAVLALQRYES
ncbi:MAG: hypothetical protein WBK47_01830, partial [Acetomicrobium sp.]